MKLVFFGLSITSSWGNGHATTYRGLCRALAERGHRIVFHEWDAPWYSGDHRDLPPAACDFADIRLYDDWDAVRPAVARTLRGADAVLLGSYVRQGVEVADWLAQEFAGPRLYYDIDTPVTVKSYRDDGAAEYLRADQVPIFDVYFSFTGGPVLDELEERYDSPCATPLYCAVDPERHRPRRARAQYECALGYMGTYAPDRQPGLERMLNEPARRRPERQFIVAGPMYPHEIDWPPNVRCHDHIPPAEHPAFYSSNRLTLNLTRTEMRRWGWSPSVRIFEAAACGAAIVSDRWDGLTTFLTPGREILLPDGPDDVVDYLELDDREVRDIGEAARERVLGEHTNRVRARQFEAALERAARPERSTAVGRADSPRGAAGRDRAGAVTRCKGRN